MISNSVAAYKRLIKNVIHSMKCKNIFKKYILYFPIYLKFNQLNVDALFRISIKKVNVTVITRL